MILATIKGYVKFWNKKVPITWERESDKYVYEVSKVVLENGYYKKDRRLYDTKVCKKEIISFSPNPEYIRS